LRSAGNPKISEIETESGNRSVLSTVVIALMAIASKLIAKAVIINATISETAITLFARLRCNSIPVGSWLLPRDTFPSNRMPGTEADNEIESATGAFCSSALE
jgi:hypothetical protein